MSIYNQFNRIVTFGDLCNELRSEVIKADNTEINSIFDRFWLNFSTNYKDRCKRIAKKISNVDNDINEEKIINDCLDNLKFLLRNDLNLFVINLITVKRKAAIKLFEKCQYKSSSNICIDDLDEYNLYKIHYFDDLKAKIEEIYRGEEDEDYKEEITPKNINDFLTFLKKENLIDVYSIVHHNEQLQKFGQHTVFIVDNLEDIYFQIIETALINYYSNN